MKEEFLQALNFAYFYLKFRPRSKKEMTDYLNKKAKRYRWAEKVVGEAVKDLEDLDLLNDKKFIEWFVEQKAARKPRSVFLMRRQLLKHGVSKELIDRYFQEHEVDEEEVARQAISSRFARWKSLPKDKRFQKVAAFLSRRGFSYDIIKKTIAKLEENDI